ncbi:MAG: hypothetical protein HC897_16175, partial [Thermoanaerobaculia bacterium]|nr:hypothetical protein [Thermoanaerobaculia bacterium]
EREVVLAVGEEKLRVTLPPLERDEPDENAILYTAFAVLRKDADPQGVECLRRAAMEQFDAALRSSEELTVVRDLARLVGHFRLVDSQALRTLFLNQLHGYLDGGLSSLPPLEEMLQAEGEKLERAVVAFDVWLATLPILAPVQSHLLERLQAVLRDGCAGRLGTGKRFERQMSLLFLVFRALIKLEPALAASEWMLKMCQLVATYSVLDQKLEYRWLALCQHQGIVFTGYPEWRSEFVAGLKKARIRLLLGARHGVALFRECVEVMQLGEEAADDCVQPTIQPRPALISFEAPLASTGKTVVSVPAIERTLPAVWKPQPITPRILPLS